MTLAPVPTVFRGIPPYEANPVIGNRTMLACGRRITCPTCNGKRIVQEPFPQGCQLCKGTATVLQHDRLATVTSISEKKVKS